MLRAALLVSALLGACSGSSRGSAGAAQDGAGAAGNAGASSGADAWGGANASGGPVANDAGSSSEQAGAFSAVPHAGSGGASDAGVSGMLASAGTPPDPSDDPLGGSAGQDAVPIDYCLVASLDHQDPLQLSASIATDYRQAVINNCHYAGLGCGFDKIAFANALRPYAYYLWHCAGSTTVSFPLVYPGEKVTPAEADALIDLYVLMMTRRLQLSASETLGLRAQILALAAASIDAGAATISLCDSGAACSSGGAAGNAGAGGNSGAAQSGAGNGGASTPAENE